MDVPWAGLAERQHRRITGVRRGSLNRPSFRIIFITICDGSLVPIKYAFRTPYQVRILESTTLKLAKSTPSVLRCRSFGPCTTGASATLTEGTSTTSYPKFAFR
ncbi:uncharacterized protein LOC6047749 [Culex quinquefasciatus]|uniref:uncharacterized protein LOC6047749 n=1 Tax=Culex quinquefasciatus TaxID=7176 RepID=UPI0018E34466|nr:uncharacterized protein LOC6047749 [Culex quinquefasciatus]